MPPIASISTKDIDAASRDDVPQLQMELPRAPDVDYRLTYTFALSALCCNGFRAVTLGALKVFAFHGSVRILGLDLECALKPGADGFFGITVASEYCYTPTSVLETANPTFAYLLPAAATNLRFSTTFEGFGTELKRVNTGNPLPVITCVSADTTLEKDTPIGYARCVITFRCSSSLPNLVLK